MEITQLKLQLKEIIRHYDLAVTQLKDSVLKDSGFAFYQTITTAPIFGFKARQQIADYLTLRNWPSKDRSQEEIDLELFQFMVLQASPFTANAVGYLNSTKDEFRKFHSRVRSHRMKDHSDTEMKASEYFRSLLPKGDEYLNPHIIDRNIPIVDGNPSKIKISVHISRFSQRKTIADAQKALQKKIDMSSMEDQITALMAEFDALDTKPSDFPIVFRNRKPVKTLKYRAANVIKNGKRSSVSGYARNPIFYISDMQFTPMINLPAEITGKEKPKNRGRPPIVSDISVSESLPDWFWYLEGKEPYPTNDTSNPIDKKKKQNPLAKTIVPGIWLESNPLRFEVKRIQGAQTSVRIYIEDIENSWKQALKKRFGNEYNEEEMDYLTPPSFSDIEAFIRS